MSEDEKQRAHEGATVDGLRDAETERASPRGTGSDVDDATEANFRRRTRRSFLVGGVSVLGALAGWQWLRTRPEEDGVPWPLRRGLGFNEKLSRAYFGNRPAATYDGTGRELPRVNGDIGLGEDFDSASWKLRVSSKTSGQSGRGEERELTLADIKRLPRVEYITYLKCIEGWSDMAHWAGARFSDFAATYAGATGIEQSPGVPQTQSDLPPYVSLSTPDDEYYVGLDTASAMHPQTLLVYEMGGQPLTPEHGAPLRLFTPVKYGVKNLKRIGRIHFTDERPRDYWAERGYDWYAGH
ncbi:MAG: molybdopterin-dependent oxidoreductase [Pyrinomonadaceae bacterium]